MSHSSCLFRDMADENGYSSVNVLVCFSKISQTVVTKAIESHGQAYSGILKTVVNPKPYRMECTEQKVFVLHNKLFNFSASCHLCVVAHE